MQEFYEHITLEEASKLALENKDNKDFIILDVRTPQELMGGVIGEPVNIDIYDSEFAAKIGALDKEKTYLVYCRSGNRSKAAAGLMKQLGFKKIYEVDRGIMG
ncbi:MAG: rhodanese-like domain-containing protein [Candidatus Moranbacteria bacterium]|nr:rhodanese-like domain-containing protein [Candidatus Moranbacteria bacterium]